jgi:6-phosphofructokinase
MTATQKNVVALSVAFGVMLGTAIAAYAIPIPALRDVLHEHAKAVIIWTMATSAGWVAARLVHDHLP